MSDNMSGAAEMFIIRKSCYLCKYVISRVSKNTKM